MGLESGEKRWVWVFALALAACGPSVGGEDTGQGGGGTEDASAGDDSSGDDSSGDGSSGDGSASGGSSSPRCAAESCGGDPEGVWAVLGACVVDLGSPNAAGCEPETCTVEILGAQGDYAFGTNSNLDLDLDLDARCRLPKTCFDDGQCDANGDDENGSCVDAGDACDCSRVFDASFSAGGRYLVEGDALELQDGDVVWTTSDWCVEGDTLEIEASVSWGVPGYRSILGLRTSLERVE